MRRHNHGFTFLWAGIGAVLGLIHCTDNNGTANTPPLVDGGVGNSDATVVPLPDSGPPPGTDGAVAGSDGPFTGLNPNVALEGTDLADGKNTFDFETFGNEGFWTDAARLPQGIVAAQLTPVQALKAGLSVDVSRLSGDTQKAVQAEIAAQGANGPILNSFQTTISLLNAQAVIGVVVKDTNGDGTVDVASGDKVGVTCSLCHAITDHSVFNLPTGGSVGLRVDGPAAHTINVGAILALAANSRAFYPNLQLKGADGTSIGRAPSSMGLTKDSTEAEVDAYLSNPDYYPVGMFDDTVDGNGNPMHNTPLFEGKLAAPWGSAGELSHLDQFSNTVFTALLDPTDILTPGGKAFLHKAAGAAGDQLAADYAAVLAATGVTGYPYVQPFTTAVPAMDPVNGDGLLGIRVDNTKLLNLNLYVDSLKAPAGQAGDPLALGRGRNVFRTTGGCTNCHNVDQSTFVPPMIVPMKSIFPGDNPMVLAQRDPPLSPVENTPGNTFDDKMIVVNASLRGLVRGSAMPLLMDLTRKPVFLHDNSVPTLDNLLDPVRGPNAAHPFYLTNSADRADMVAYLQSLDDTSK